MTGEHGSRTGTLWQLLTKPLIQQNVSACIVSHLEVVLLAHDPGGDAVDRLRVEVDRRDHHAVTSSPALPGVGGGGIEPQRGQGGC